MAKNPTSSKGDIAEKQAALHFRLKGYSVFHPSVDNGADFVIREGEGPYIGVQVKKLNDSKNGSNRLTNQHYGDRHGDFIDRSRREANSQRPYDLLVLVGEKHIWVIPEIETRGITGISAVSRGKRPRTMKWDKFKEERLHWAKPENAG